MPMALAAFALGVIRSLWRASDGEKGACASFPSLNSRWDRQTSGHTRDLRKVRASIICG
jgi:hypothetical protein